ncbi:odorant receptor 22a-like [Cylas formicarius]|uniref:odorant receptor 22a-like n=1 Tax=Cylas formicarius TaxID=197179 RepID=UPI002958BDF4|nr:odorant receptor 22a-like [Cylas formicarius]XP_060526088.1 odorant receptor 22a-like [Cylas formicarius]
MPNRSMLDFSRLNMTYAGIWRFGPSSKRLIRFLYLLYSTFVFIYFPVFLTSLTIQFSIMLSFDEEFKAAPQKVFRTITLMITLWTVEIKAKLIQTARIKRIIAYILAEETKIRHSPDEDVARCYFEQAKFCRRSNLIIFSVTMTVATSMIVGNFVQCRQVEQHNRLRNDTISKSFTYELYYAGLDRKMAESVLEATNDLSVLIAASLVSSTQLVFISCMIFATSLIKIMQIRFRKMVTYGDDVVVTLRDLVLEHQKVIDFVDQLNAAMKNLILLEYLLHSLNFASVSIQFIKSERNISMAFPVCYLGLLVVQTFFLGWNANEVKIQSLMMADALYESPWYEQTQEVKGLLLVALTRSQRPLTLTIGPFDAMTVESSLTIMKASYSYVTVMIQSYR